MMTAYDALMAHRRQTEALAQVAGLCGWDQETMMPRGAAEQRAEWMGALEATLHARRTDPRVGDWLAEIDDAALDAVGRANLRHIRREYARATRVPEALATRLAALTSRAQGIWAKARAADDFAAFAPTLAEVVTLKREEAAALADGGDLYDALADDYEPGITGAELAAMFDRMRPRLVTLRAAVLERGPEPARLTGDFPRDAQVALARKLAGTFGYDWDRGRLDFAVHPFSSGHGNDSRITTRIDTADPFNCLYSTVHEAGHSSYEQNVDPAYLFTPLGAGVSMGVHESQSRIFENQFGRSPQFCGWLFGQMGRAFGDIGVTDAQAFTRSVNAVRRGYIRTEADELQYNLHIMLRFDLERAIIAGDLDVADLETAWNDRFAADFGYPVDKPSNGVLQDVHWSVGLFGYFPTYSLGNVYAGCLYKALRDDLPALDDDLARGDTGAALGWLRERVQRHGGLMPPREVIAGACGFEPDEGPLLDYLDAKFTALYGL